MKKILIIEDDQVVAGIYRSKLTSAGYDIQIAADGQTGLDLVQSFKPELVMLDLMLPRINGVQLLKTIRGIGDFKQLPIIVFSNTYLPNLIQEAWKAGATKCLSKASSTPKQVLDIITALLHDAPVPSAGPKTGGSGQDSPCNVRLSSADVIQRTFIESLPSAAAGFRLSLQSLAKSPAEAGKVKALQELYRHIHTITSNAGISGFSQIAQTADVAEALVMEMYEKPDNITPSTLRTVAMAVDFLTSLFDRVHLPESTAKHDHLQGSAMVVDDDPICRRAVVEALGKARLKTSQHDDPSAALELLTCKPFDLIVLDVDMPSMNGYELCASLRKVTLHRKTPVVFVTGLSDFESRANSTISGGNDFLAKPFLFIELAVKALVMIQRFRLTPLK